MKGVFASLIRYQKARKRNRKKRKQIAELFPFNPPLMSKSRASNGERKTEEQKRKKSFQILNSHVGTRYDQYFL
jgi:hypothetical protein